MQHDTENNQLEHAHHNHHEHVHHSTHNSIEEKKITNTTAIIIGAFLIMVGLLGHGFLSKNSNSSSGTLAYLDVFGGKAPTEDSYVEGKKDSKVYFIEYSDTQCPYCIAFHHTVTALREKYAGKVTFIYRHFPLVQIHPNALPEAIQMTCAGKLKGEKAYYSFMTKLFDYKAEQQASKISPEFTSTFLTENNIDKTSFESCTKDPAIEASVMESLQDGSQAGVTGTPTSFILVKDEDDYKIIKRVEGAAQASFIIPLIDKALKS